MARSVVSQSGCEQPRSGSSQQCDNRVSQPPTRSVVMSLHARYGASSPRVQGPGMDGSGPLGMARGRSGRSGKLGVGRRRFGPGGDPGSTQGVLMARDLMWVPGRGPEIFSSLHHSGPTRDGNWGCTIETARTKTNWVVAFLYGCTKWAWRQRSSPKAGVNSRSPFDRAQPAMRQARLAATNPLSSSDVAARPVRRRPGSRSVGMARGRSGWLGVARGGSGGGLRCEITYECGHSG